MVVMTSEGAVNKFLEAKRSGTKYVAFTSVYPPFPAVVISSQSTNIKPII
jgi:hypothetical protein